MAHARVQREVRELRPNVDWSLRNCLPQGRLFAISVFFLAVLFFESGSYGQNPPRGGAAENVKGTAVTAAAKDSPGNAEQAKNNDANSSSLRNGQIEDVDLVKGSVALRTCNSECNGAQLRLTIPAERVGTLRGFYNGDRVAFGADAQSVLQTIKLTSRPVNKTDRLMVLGCSLLLCFLGATLLTWWHPLKLIIGEDGRYSNSKFQMAIWFCLVIASYLAVVYLRLTRIGWESFGHVNIPSNLLLLSGMSALTFAGAKGITTAKVDAAAVQGKANPKPAGQPRFWQDLLQNDLGTFDLGDFQMLVVTALAAVMYIASFSHFLSLVQAANPTYLPDIDTTILATFGLGQGAYLTKKAVGNAASS